MTYMEPVSTSRLRHWRMRVEMNDPLFEGMKKIKLRGKELDNPPREVFHIHDLEVLDLSPERQSCLYYHLTSVPTLIARLQNLRILMLDTNDLTELPRELCHLIGLEKISLSNNCLKELPDDFSKLVNLSSLHAANNSFEEFPEVICRMKMLSFLDLSDNLIAVLPERLGDLATLESLLLYANQIVLLPEAISYLVRLRILWIGNNRIRKLPKGITKLTLLDWDPMHTWSTALDGNPLEDPPMHVCKRGVYAIERYFKSESREETPPQITES